MTVPLRRPQAPARWDLQGEFARVERQLERGVWTDRMSALVLAGAMSWVWLLLRDGDEWGLLGAPVVLVLFLALSVGSWRLDRWRLQRVGGPAAPSPSSIGQVTTEARGSDIWVAVHAALAAQNSARTGFRDSNTVEATLARPFLDLLITVRVEGDEARGGLVTVWVRPSIPRSLRLLVGYPHDGGTARKSANGMLRAIPGAHDVVREPLPASQA